MIIQFPPGGRDGRPPGPPTDYAEQAWETPEDMLLSALRDVRFERILATGAMVLLYDDEKVVMYAVGLNELEVAGLLEKAQGVV